MKKPEMIIDIPYICITYIWFFYMGNNTGRTNKSNEE